MWEMMLHHVAPGMTAVLLCYQAAETAMSMTYSEYPPVAIHVAIAIPSIRSKICKMEWII